MAVITDHWSVVTSHYWSQSQFHSELAVVSWCLVIILVEVGMAPTYQQQLIVTYRLAGVFLCFSPSNLGNDIYFIKSLLLRS